MDGHILWKALVDAYDDFTQLVMINLLWFIFTIPLLTAPPAIAGLFYATNRLAHRQSVTWRTFFDGFRERFWLGWRWSLANLLVIGIGLFNVWFYGQLQTSWAGLAQGLFSGVIVLWLLLQVYTFPILLEQTAPRLSTAMRNSLTIYIRRPGFSLSLAATLLVIAVLSSIFLAPWVLFTAGLVAFLANRCSLHLIADLSNKTREEQPGS